MTNVERAGGTWYGNINHHVALFQYLFSNAVTLIAGNKGYILRQFTFV